jgi:hypothetical protein
MKTKQQTEPKYPVGIAARHRYEKKRCRIVTRKWSNKSGWWYELRDDEMFVRSVPERDVQGMED